MITDAELEALRARHPRREGPNLKREVLTSWPTELTAYTRGKWDYTMPDGTSIRGVFWDAKEAGVTNLPDGAAIFLSDGLDDWTRISDYHFAYDFKPGSTFVPYNFEMKE